jgi:hypothetical protein
LPEVLQEDKEESVRQKREQLLLEFEEFGVMLTDYAAEVHVLATREAKQKQKRAMNKMLFKKRMASMENMLRSQMFRFYASRFKLAYADVHEPNSKTQQWQDTVDEALERVQAEIDTLDSEQIRRLSEESKLIMKRKRRGKEECIEETDELSDEWSPKMKRTRQLEVDRRKEYSRRPRTMNCEKM